MRFPASVILNITNQSCHHLSVIFEDVYFFLWSSIFSIYLLPADIWEENQVYTGGLTYHEQTVRLIKFYLMKNMKGNRANWLAQFPFCECFPHFTVFCSSASFSNNLNYCCQQIQGAFKMCSYYHFNPWEWLAFNFSFHYHP